MLPQFMNMLLALFSPKQLASVIFISLPALVLTNLPTQAGQDHSHHAAAFLAEKVLSSHTPEIACNMLLVKQDRT